MSPTEARHGFDAAGIAIAAGLFALAAVTAWDASTLQLSFVYGLGRFRATED